MSSCNTHAAARYAHSCSAAGINLWAEQQVQVAHE